MTDNTDNIKLFSEPVEGKTYSLFGESGRTDKYFNGISNFVDCLLLKTEQEVLLSELRIATKSIKQYKKFKLKFHDFFDFNTFEIFAENHTKSLDSHLECLTLKNKFNKTMNLKRFQYGLFMIEIDLTNKISLEKFRNAEYKFALLPHCLHDLQKNCLAESDGFESVCKRCSKACYLRKTSDTLRNSDINPYIWMTQNLKTMFKKLYKDYKSVGVLGIACIPELVYGLRRCFNNGVPAIGLPLNANRCVRWFGEFLPNSINLSELENLVVLTTTLEK